MKKVIAMILALSLLVPAAMAGCKKANTSSTATSSESSKPVNLTFMWWGTQPRNDATMKVIDMYHTAHPNVTITGTYQTIDGYYQKLSMLAAANNMPDLFQGNVGGPDFQAYLDKNQVEPLDTYISKKVIDTSKISAISLGSGKCNSKMYGMPLGINARAMVVDTAIYSKAGLTVPSDGYASWDAVEKDMVKLKTVTGAYGADDLLIAGVTFYYYCRQQGETFFTDGTKDKTKLIGFSEKTYVDYYNMKLSWQKQGLIPPVDLVLSQLKVTDSQLAKHKAAINIIYSNGIDSLQKASGDPLQMIPMPGPNAKKAEDVRGSCHVSISSKSANKTEAAKFVSYFVNDIDANKVLNCERGMVVSLPAKLTAATGIDAITHGIECYVASGTYSVFTDAICLESLRLLFKFLPQATVDGGNIEARGATLVASCMAGVAFTNSGVGITHALAHAVGAKYATHHGMTNAVFLPHGMRFNLDTVYPRYARIAQFLGFADEKNIGDERALANLLVNKVEALLGKLQLPLTLRELGVPELSDENLAELTDLAAADPAIMFNPREASSDDLTQLLKRAY